MTDSQMAGMPLAEHASEAGRSSPEAFSGELLSLGRAASLAPGRPSANALWRWCRRGVLARSGQRIKLQCIRQGAKILTSEKWLRQFGEKLADADAAYFDRNEKNGGSPPQLCGTPPDRGGDEARRAQLAQVEHELEEAGL